MRHTVGTLCSRNLLQNFKYSIVMTDAFVADYELRYVQ
jgi:hypothetical protein